MLPRAQRLSAAEFARVFENGRVLRHPLFQLRVARRERTASDADAAVSSAVRAAFVAPKKLGKATLRNRLRRRVRERFRLLQNVGPSVSEERKNNAHPGEVLSSGFAGRKIAHCDLIWIIGGAAETATSEELDGALQELLRRAARFLEKDRE